MKLINYSCKNEGFFFVLQFFSARQQCLLEIGGLLSKIHMRSMYRMYGSSHFDADSCGQWKTLWGLAASFLLSSTVLKPLARRALRKFLFQTEGSPWARPPPLTSAQACGAEQGWKPKETPDVNGLRRMKNGFVDKELDKRVDGRIDRSHTLKMRMSVLEESCLKACFHGMQNSVRSGFVQWTPGYLPLLICSRSHGMSSGFGWDISATRQYIQ